MIDVELKHFHLFAGLGGGALGFNRGRAEVHGLRSVSRCIGGVDVSPAAVRDFRKLAGVEGTLLDLFDREQYIAFHGNEPPTGWSEATPDDIRRAAGGEFPNVVFLSAPCKGFSGLLSETRSKTGKYQALNRLTLRGVWLMLEAFKDDLPELIIFENVPRIATRGRKLLDQIAALYRAYGYTSVETTHDCGELGHLAQSRKRFLLVARNLAKVPNFLYEPPKRPLRAVGEILDKLPMPGDPRGGAMHRLPNLQWQTWVRLAFVEAGSDWRSLNKLSIVDGNLRDFALMPDSAWYRGMMGVNRWDSPTGVVTGMAAPMRGNFSVADPRFDGHEFGQFGVRDWTKPTGTVTGQGSPGQGPLSVADPRLSGENGPRFNNVYRVVRYSEHTQAVSGGAMPSAGGLSVADPRPPSGPNFSKYMVTPYDRAAGTVIGGDDQGAYAVADPRPGWTDRYGALAVADWERPSSTIIAGGKGVQGGWLSVADPRPSNQRIKGDAYLTNGHYGVVSYDEPCGAISAAAGLDNGRWSVADPRLPAANEKLIAIIRSIDGTWHRPFTTLELAALQSLIDPEDIIDLDGDADGAKRERIGNAVPPDAAQAVADIMFHTILLARAGATFQLSAAPIWVHPVAVALSVKNYDGAAA